MSLDTTDSGDGLRNAITRAAREGSMYGVMKCVWLPVRDMPPQGHSLETAHARRRKFRRYATGCGANLDDKEAIDVQ
jgi:hypothetical protein